MALLTVLSSGAGAAYAADTFGAIQVVESGTKVSEASGGKTYDPVNTLNDISTDIRFRDVTADGWSTYARVYEEGKDCLNCAYYSVAKDETNKYGSADGWRNSTLHQDDLQIGRWRAKPGVCHHNGAFTPDNCNYAGYQYP
ncbi:hypothetical protein [Nocardioides sp.]|uniref:hypothetical protein n=1 Tax=Nocardioides sp. TaxID=35761 RepID=UPI003D109B04